ncbi:MAG TPA: class I SAM-dependent rRNA methyltransferase [Dongiaceae bacterium]|nr:class I SAM-dependent rRNA methyltransferase [Dongiaceae bacterium]
MTDPIESRPAVAMRPGADKRLAGGHPWAFSNEIEMDAAAKALPPGELVTLRRHDGRTLGVALFNPHSLIAARVLSRDPTAEINARFFERRLQRALKLRQRLVGVPFYRLAHAEADGFPGAVIDRFGDVVVVELNSAGMDRLTEPLTAAIDKVLSPRTILLRGEGSARDSEGLAPMSRFAKGGLEGPITVEENGAHFLADLSAGQKTGWFYDQRDNRALMAGFSKGGTFLDVYSYTGGFGVQAAVAGATEVLAIDRSEAALSLLQKSAQLNGVGAQVSVQRGEAFDALESLIAGRRRFDIVSADPPAFVKSKKDFHVGGKAYRKLARLACQAVEPGGLLFIASCSHNMPADEFAQQVARGIHEGGRSARQLYATGAAPDHPVHPFLPESAYLKALVLQVD